MYPFKQLINFNTQWFLTPPHPKKKINIQWILTIVEDVLKPCALINVLLVQLFPLNFFFQLIKLHFSKYNYT